MSTDDDLHELYLDHAEKCERFAAAEKETTVRAHFAELATQWRALAEVASGVRRVESELRSSGQPLHNPSEALPPTDKS
jgi:hypothetical protein